jgi:hypothetical protein
MRLQFHPNFGPEVRTLLAWRVARGAWRGRGKFVKKWAHGLVVFRQQLDGVDRVLRLVVLESPTCAAGDEVASCLRYASARRGLPAGTPLAFPFGATRDSPRFIQPRG